MPILGKNIVRHLINFTLSRLVLHVFVFIILRMSRFNLCLRVKEELLGLVLILFGEFCRLRLDTDEVV